MTDTAYVDSSCLVAMALEENGSGAVGHVRGADLWHLAHALFLSPDRAIDFVTLDVRQRDISRRLGFGPRSS